MLCSGCTYMGNRGRDFAQIFDLALETKHVGVGVQVGPLRTGLSMGKGKGYGLRDGSFTPYEFQKADLLITGVDAYWRPHRGWRHAAYAWCVPTGRVRDITIGPWQKHTSLEVSVAAYYGIRAGVNLGEAADFLTGLFTFDLCGDDRPAPEAEGQEISKRPDRRQVRPPKRPRPTPLPPPFHEPETVLIRGSTYLRPGPVPDPLAFWKRRQQVEVTVADFYIGKYEVTFDEYDTFCADTGRDEPDDRGRGRGRLPVIMVSRNDAGAYCRWLSETTGKTYRLPTHREWDYAARGAEARRYPWGSEPPEADGKFRANLQGHADGYHHAAPVGTFPLGQTPEGVYDMLGNVAEWCQERPGWRGVYAGITVWGDQPVGRWPETRIPAHIGWRDVGFRVLREAQVVQGRDSSIRPNDE